MARKTNVQLIKSMMEFSDFGALAQMFIMDTIVGRAEVVANTPIEDLRKSFPENSFISPDAWQGVAKEILAKYQANN